MKREQHFLSRGLSRRAALRLLGFGGGMALLAACGPIAQPAPTPPSAPPAPTLASAQPAATPASAAPPAAVPATTAPASAASKATGDTLNVAIADLGSDSNDPMLAQPNNPSYVIFEPLLRYDPQGSITPWLA